MTTDPRRSLLLHGLRLAFTRGGAVLWTYAAGLVLALVFSLRQHTQLASLLNHSLAAQRLTTAFDLGVVGAAFQRIAHDTPAGGSSSAFSLPLYFAVYFLLVPGTLFCFHVEAPAHLSILLSAGARFFWRFVRITLLTLLASVVVLGPALVLNVAWGKRIDDTMVGESSLLLQAAGWFIVLLVAALLRLYFDLVECYTVLLDDQLRPTGFADRRVRRTLLPALRTLIRNLPRAYGTFLFLLLAGLAGFVLPTWTAITRLARPDVLPAFLLAQLGLLLLLFSRFWQRGAAMILALDNPLLVPAVLVATQPEPEPEPRPQPQDHEPDPEPGVFPSDAHADQRSWAPP